MKKTNYAWSTLLCLLLAAPAWAVDESVVIEELQTDVSVTKVKADDNANKIKNLEGGLPAVEARVTELENSPPAPGSCECDITQEEFQALTARVELLEGSSTTFNVFQMIWENDSIVISDYEWADVREIIVERSLDETSLEVAYEENATSRAFRGWEGITIRILFDGKPCTQPGIIEKDFSHYSPVNDIYFTDNLYTKAICSSNEDGPFFQGTHSITVQAKRSHTTAIAWGPILSYRPDVSEFNSIARLSAKEVF